MCFIVFFFIVQQEAFPIQSRSAASICAVYRTKIITSCVLPSLHFTPHLKKVKKISTNRYTAFQYFSFPVRLLRFTALSTNTVSVSSHTHTIPEVLPNPLRREPAPPNGGGSFYAINADFFRFFCFVPKAYTRMPPVVAAAREEKIENLLIHLTRGRARANFQCFTFLSYTHLKVENK